MVINAQEIAWYRIEVEATYRDNVIRTDPALYRIEVEATYRAKVIRTNPVISVW